MIDLLNIIKEFIINLSKNQYFMTLVCSIVVAGFTHWLTLKNTAKPTKLKIQQTQLDKVYLPLYRLLKDISNDIDLQSAINIHNQLTAILNDYYEFVFPQLHDLNDILNNKITAKCGYQKILLEIKHQVSVDYDLLKKSLGYPSENIINILIRMSKEKRIAYILSYLNMLLPLVAVISTIYSAIDTKHPDEISASIPFLIIGVPIILLDMYYLLLKKSDRNKYPKNS